MQTPVDVYRRFVDGYQTGNDADIADEILAADFIDHTPFPGFAPTRDGVKNLFTVLRQAFPDLRAEILDQVANGDKVATRKVFHATHMGAFLGIPATGRTVTIPVIDFVRVAGGQITEHWNIVDVAGLMRQIS